MVDEGFLLNAVILRSKNFLLYTDPGAGSLLWQLLLASFIGGAFYVRLMARRIRQRMTGFRKAEETSDLLNTRTSQTE